MIDKYLKTKKGNIFYYISDHWDNGKETIFFFHGLTADHTMFEPQCRYFQEKYNVIVWDAPCHGKSRPYGHDYYSKSDIFWLKQIGWMGMCYPLYAMKKASSKQATSTKIGYENMMEMLAPYGKREYCDLMQRAYDAFLQDNFDLEITCPVLITSGEFDKVGKVKTYCKMWHEKTGYPWIVIEGAGHNANVDNPTQMNRVIEEFLVGHHL